MKVYKYQLNYFSKPEIVKLPIGAKIIEAGIQKINQGGEIPETQFVFWALVDESAEKEERTLSLALTGQEIKGEVLKVFNTFTLPRTGIVLTFVELKINQ